MAALRLSSRTRKAISRWSIVSATWKILQQFGSARPRQRREIPFRRSKPSTRCGGAMGYRVEITPQALADAEAAALFIAQHSPRAASRWFDRLLGAVGSLAERPQRCREAPEVETLGLPLHQL